MKLKRHWLSFLFTLFGFSLCFSQSTIYNWKKQFNSSDLIVQLPPENEVSSANLINFINKNKVDTLLFELDIEGFRLLIEPNSYFKEMLLPTGDRYQFSARYNDTTIKYFTPNGFNYLREIKKGSGNIQCNDHYLSRTAQSNYQKRGGSINYWFYDVFGVKTSQAEFINGVWYFTDYPTFGETKIEQKKLVFNGDTIGIEQKAQNGSFDYRLNCKDSTMYYRFLNPNQKIDLWERYFPGSYFFTKRVGEDSITIVQKNPSIYFDRLTTQYGFEERYFENGELTTVQRQQNPKPGNQYYRQLDTFYFLNQPADTANLLIEKYHEENGNVIMERNYYKAEISINENENIEVSMPNAPFKKEIRKRNRNMNEYKIVRIKNGKRTTEKTAKRIEFFDALKARKANKTTPQYSRPFMPYYSSQDLLSFSKVEVVWPNQKIKPYPKYVTFINADSTMDFFEVNSILSRYSKQNKQTPLVSITFEGDTVIFRYNNNSYSPAALIEALFQTEQQTVFLDNSLINLLTFLQNSEVKIGEGQYLISDVKSGKESIKSLQANPPAVELVWDLRGGED